MAKVAKTLQGELSSAFPDNVILVGTLSDDGFVQISPRGSVIVFGDDTLGFWNRGTGKTHEAIL